MPEPVATDGDGHPGGTYAVFAPGDCDKPLPLNRITDVFRFSKFVGLLVAVQGYGSRRVVLPRTAIVPGVARTVAANPSATMLDVEGGYRLRAAANYRRWARPRRRRSPSTTLIACWLCER